MLGETIAPKISIIVPCLNSAKYMREAMNSLVNQSLRDIEIIVVDAGSTDGTLDILSEYAGSDPRVKILRSDKKSTGRQYNMGMEAAAGAYIGFLESDDYAEADMYESLYAAAKGKGVDYVKANYDMFADFPEGRTFLPYGPVAPNKSRLYGRVVGAKELACLLPRDCYIWNGIYRRDFITGNGIRFNDTPGAAFQDAGFVVQALALADAALYIDKSLYRYRRDNPGSSFIDKNAYAFAMDEFLCIDRFMQATARNLELFEPLILRKYFGLFNYNLKRFLCGETHSARLEERAAPFREAFRRRYDALGFVKRSRSDLWPPQNLLLFFDDFERYCSFTRRLALSDYGLHADAAAFFRRQKELVIWGSGEKAGSVYCYLRRSGLQNVAAFCGDASERASGKVMGFDILTPEAAVAAHPGDMYLVTAANADEARNRLMECGVAADRICYYGAGLDPHSCFEIPAGVR
ncbi:MAG: glycosyltransferase [Clostridiales Family XIII bacterium]|jgi:glycosyltransferase involved in cell wall biosynthesis|nr:glycosyltransferase [Clostridiales Family XIII bacterium]